MFSKEQLYITCKDHYVSEKEFELWYNKKYDMLITVPQPEKEELPSYYKTQNYISHTDARKSFFEKAYQTVKKQNTVFKVKTINKLHPKKGTILDIGAGTGDFLLAMKKNGWETTGIEPNENARVLAEKKGVFLRGQNQLEKQSYDVITMWHVLEHIPDLKEQVKKMKKHLTPTGSLFIAVPNYKSYDAQYYKNFWAAYDVPRHFWHFSKKTISMLFSEVEMKVVKTIPMKFDAYYVSLLSEKYQTGKMNFIKGAYRGWLSNRKAKANKEYSSHIFVIKNN
ncbi:class I SAM-dependent methyltransferase [Leptobacterium sp. I13]|uniref:class I SAM-dependent methyltransferase n=1 Tax=Leptobacterium meishanense TaxID=3128904 RepID=UPI0030ED2D89